MVRRPFAVVALLAAAASPALATTRSSFLEVSGINGISVTSLGGLSYEVALDAAPTFTYNAQVYPITDVFGFYALSDDVDLLPLSNLSPVGNFSDDSTNAGIGGVAGWRSNPNQGLTPGQSLVFTFDGLDQPHVDRFGFHVRLNNMFFPNTTGNTGNITYVPAPGAGALALVAVAFPLARRRR